MDEFMLHPNFYSFFLFLHQFYLSKTVASKFFITTLRLSYLKIFSFVSHKKILHSKIDQKSLTFSLKNHSFFVQKTAQNCMVFSWQIFLTLISMGLCKFFWLNFSKIFPFQFSDQKIFILCLKFFDSSFLHRTLKIFA